MLKVNNNNKLLLMNFQYKMLTEMMCVAGGLSVVNAVVYVKHFLQS